MTINVIHFYYFDLSYYFIHKNMYLNYVFGHVIFYRLKLKLKQKISKTKGTECLSICKTQLFYYIWHKVNVD